VLDQRWHTFRPGGVTGLLLLAVASDRPHVSRAWRRDVQFMLLPPDARLAVGAAIA
jgi:hypothetical protein